jgi:Flp pilus assembly protein TadB
VPAFSPRRAALGSYADRYHLFNTPLTMIQTRIGSLGRWLIAVAAGVAVAAVVGAVFHTHGGAADFIVGAIVAFLVMLRLERARRHAPPH